LRYHVDSLKVTTTAKWQHDIIQLSFKHHFRYHTNIILTSFRCHSDIIQTSFRQHKMKTASVGHSADIVQTSFRYHSNIIDTSFKHYWDNENNDNIINMMS
jgi:hypothetical protein